MFDIPILVAFFAGLVSFLAPCVLPLMPGFLAYLAGGVRVDGQTADRKEIFINSVFFVLGFSLVFATLGVLLNTLLEAFAYDVQTWLSRIGGAIIIFFGLYLLGLFRFRFLEKEHKIHIEKKFNSRYLTSFIFGLAFAVGWTPCVGAVLGGILALAATQSASAFFLLLAYALGLGIPFLILGAFTAQASQLIRKYLHLVKYVNFLFGIILIVLGILVFTGSLSQVANFQFVNDLILN